MQACPGTVCACAQASAITAPRSHFGLSALQAVAINSHREPAHRRLGRPAYSAPQLGTMPATNMSSSSKKKALAVRAETASNLDPMLTEALQDVMDALVAELANMLPCLRNVKSEKYLFKETAAQDDEAPFHSTYKRLRAPTDFLRSYLAMIATESGRHDVGDIMLQSLDKGGDSSVHDLLYFDKD